MGAEIRSRRATSGANSLETSLSLKQLRVFWFAVADLSDRNSLLVANGQEFVRASRWHPPHPRLAVPLSAHFRQVVLEENGPAFSFPLRHAAAGLPGNSSRESSPPPWNQKSAGTTDTPAAQITQALPLSCGLIAEHFLPRLELFVGHWSRRFSFADSERERCARTNRRPDWRGRLSDFSFATFSMSFETFGGSKAWNSSSFSSRR